MKIQPANFINKSLAEPVKFNGGNVVLRKYPPSIFYNLKLIFMRKYSIFFMMLLCIFSCNQHAGNSKTQNSVSQDTTRSVNDPVRNGITKIILSEPGQKIIVPSGKIQQVIGKKGIRITVDPSALETINGEPLGSQIEIELKEINNQEDLFKNDAPTISDGQLLVSGGAYYIGMSSGGNQLKIKPGKGLSIQIPKTSKNEMQLFYGERDSAGVLNWVAAGKKITPEKIITLDTAIALKNKIITEVAARPIKDTSKQISDLERLFNYADERGGRISAAEFKALVNSNPVDSDGTDFTTRVTEVLDTITGKKMKEVYTNYYNPVEIKNLGWINCDRFYNSPGKSEIRCEFDSSLNVTSAAIYVIFKNINSMLKETVIKSNDMAPGKLKNQYPVGESVTIIGVTNVGGKFYESKQELVLQSNELIKFRFSPINDLELLKTSYRF